MQCIAKYNYDFLDYDIKNIDKYGIVILSDKDCSDIVNDDISQLVFKDCTKNFDDIGHIQNKTNLLLSNKKLELKDDISVIRIIIRGYDESLDRLKFDTGFLNLLYPYKYSISDVGIEIRLDIDSSSSDVLGFLYNINYEYFGDINKNRTIFIYADADLIYTDKFVG